MLKKLFLLLFIAIPACADLVVINPQAIRNKTSDEIYLCMEDRGLYVVNITQQSISTINLAFSDKLARSLRTQEDMECFFRAYGQLILKQLSNGDYILTASIPLRGGGFLLAAGAWLGIQVVGYTAMLTGITLTNLAIPGVGPLAVTLACGGSIPVAMAAIQAAAVKAFIICAPLPTP